MEVSNQKKGKGFIVAFTILIIIILGLIGYICYDKGIILNTNANKSEAKENKPNNSTDDQNEKINTIEEVDIKSDIIQNLFSIFRLDKSCYMTVDSLNKSNLVKLRIAFDNIAARNFDSIKCSMLELSESSFCGLSSGLMKEAAAAGDMVKFREYEKQNYTHTLDANLLEAKVHELFGSNYQVTHETFGTGHLVEPSCYFMQYDKDKNLYAQFYCEGGGTCAATFQELVSASKKGDELYIVTNFIDKNENLNKITYTFKKDEKNSNYAFVKVSQE